MRLEMIDGEERHTKSERDSLGGGHAHDQAAD
jgi:hypothetical protein